MAAKHLVPAGNVVASSTFNTSGTTATSACIWAPSTSSGFGALDDCVVYVKGYIVGIESNGGNGYSGSAEALATVERRSGVLVIKNQSVLYEDAIITSLAFNTNSGNLEMKVTPNTSQTIHWFATIKIEQAYEYQ